VLLLTVIQGCCFYGVRSNGGDSLLLYMCEIFRDDTTSILFGFALFLSTVLAFGKDSLGVRRVFAWRSFRHGFNRAGIGQVFVWRFLMGTRMDRENSKPGPFTTPTSPYSASPHLAARRNCVRVLQDGDWGVFRH
jgi:hypothetical protein